MRLLVISSLLVIIAAAPLFAKEAPRTTHTPDPPNTSSDNGKDNNKNDLPEDKDEPPVWHERVVPGPTVTLRLKHLENKVLVYEGNLSRSQSSTNSYNEQDKFYLTVLCAQKKMEAINGQGKVLDMLAFRRTFTERKRTETLENHKIVHPALPNSDDLLTLGPSFEEIQRMRCYAFDEQNIMAARTEDILMLKDGRQLRGVIVKRDSDKILFSTGDDAVEISTANVDSISMASVPHVCLNESPHYLFPPFTERAVAPGDTWSFKVPVIIPVEQGTPPRVWPTQFNVHVLGRLREVRQNTGSKVAVVDYQLNGKFDSTTDEYAPRFSPEFRQNNRLMHKLSGEGTLMIDVDDSRLLEKQETINITLYANSMIVEGADKPARNETHKADITSHFDLKLLMPGTRLKNGALIPPFE